MVHGTPFIRNGYCEKCGRTARQMHHASGAVWWLHRLTFQILPRLGVGGWSCLECSTECRYLSRAPRHSTESSESASPFVPDGNFIIGDRSLVRRSLKASRYTEKFRDSVVDRLVNGQVNLESIRSELRVRESDVMAWIADRLQRQQERIDQYRKLLELFAQNHPVDRLTSHSELETRETPTSAAQPVESTSAGIAGTDSPRGSRARR